MRINNLKFLSYFTITIFLTLGLSISLQSLLADWGPPVATPPTCGVGNPGCDAPLNVSDTNQLKLGVLTLNTGGNANGLIIDQGNVGIGTPVPADKLTIFATWNPSDLLSLEDSTGIARLVFGVNGAGNYGFITHTRGMETTPDLAIGNNGNIGIGVVSPVAKLDIDMKNLTTTEGLHISRDAAASHYAYLNIVDESSNPILKVHESGNVGIGTTSPASKLSVDGIIYSGSGGIKFPDGTVQTSAGAAVKKYDSGWFWVPAVDKIHTRAHKFKDAGGDGVIPDIIQVWYSDTFNGSGDVVLTGVANYDARCTMIYDVDSTDIAIRIGKNRLVEYRNSLGVQLSPTSGWIKIVAFSFQ